MNAAAPLLLPVPRSAQFSAERCPVPSPLTASGIPLEMLTAHRLPWQPLDSGGFIRAVLSRGEHGAEAYRVVIAPDHVQITAGDSAGLRWAVLTVAQLLRQCPDSLPQGRIDDAPAFAVRGAMLDISRDRVPTMASLFEMIDRLASMKTNHFQLYIEHTFASRGHEMVWRGADPITPDEMKALDAYASARGIALTANQNSLGHFDRWLKVPNYVHLGEVSGPWMAPQWGPRYAEPSTLCPLDPGSLALVRDLLIQQVPLCSGSYVNIGCDEPWDLGAGRSKAACEKLGVKRVFSDFVTQVADIVRAMDKRPMFWCDPHPNEDDSLPRDLVALVWGYEFDQDFATRLSAHAGAGREVWVCPGTSSWLTITSRTWNRRGNLDIAATQGMAAGAKGFLNTEWGDCGHRQQWPLTLFGLAEGAAAAWSGPGHYSAAAAGLHLFDNPDVGAWLERLGNADQPISAGTAPHCKRRYNATALFNDLNANILDTTGKEELEAWRNAAAELARLAEQTPRADAVTTRECRHALRTAQWAVQRAIDRRTGEVGGEHRIRRISEMCDIIDEYRILWNLRSRYGGLEDSCNWWRRHVS